MIYKEGDSGLIRVLDTANGNVISSRQYNSLSFWQNEGTRSLLIKSDGSAAYLLGERITPGSSVCYDMQLFKFTPTLTTESAPVWARSLDSCFPQALMFGGSHFENHFLALYGYQNMTLSLFSDTAGPSLVWSYQLNNQAFNDTFLISQNYRVNNLQHVVVIGSRKSNFKFSRFILNPTFPSTSPQVLPKTDPSVYPNKQIRGLFVKSLTQVLVMLYDFLTFEISIANLDFSASTIIYGNPLHTFTQQYTSRALFLTVDLFLISTYGSSFLTNQYPISSVTFTKSQSFLFSSNITDAAYAFKSSATTALTTVTLSSDTSQTAGMSFSAITTIVFTQESSYSIVSLDLNKMFQMPNYHTSPSAAFTPLSFYPGYPQS